MKLIAIKSKISKDKSVINYLSINSSYLMKFFIEPDLGQINFLYKLYIEFGNYVWSPDELLTEEEYQIFISNYADFLNTSDKLIFNINEVVKLIIIGERENK